MKIRAVQYRGGVVAELAEINTMIGHCARVVGSASKEDGAEGRGAGQPHTAQKCCSHLEWAGIGFRLSAGSYSGQLVNGALAESICKDSVTSFASQRR